MREVVAGTQPGSSNTEEQVSPVRERHTRAFGGGRWLEIVTTGVLFLLVVVICGRAFQPLRTDFRMFYSAAQMLRHGAVHSLYDLEAQHAFQRHYVHRVGLIFDYPAATALLFLPGAWLGVWPAYVLWTSVSLLVLVIAMFALNAGLQGFEHPLALLALALLFVPIWFNLMQGQIVFFLLLAYSLALYYMSRGREFATGCALAIGLLKFHLMLPFVLVLLIRRRWRALGGFVAGSAAFAGICVAVAGWRCLIDYPRLLLHLTRLPLTGYNIWAMANLHGLMVGLAHREPPLIITLAVSLALIAASALAWNNVEFGFASGIITTVLVSYHLNPHDLSLLLIPLVVLMKNVRVLRWRALSLVLFAPPVPLLLLGPNFWMLAVCVLVLMLAMAPIGTPPPAEKIPVPA